MTGRRQIGNLRMGMLNARRSLTTRPEFVAEIGRLWDQSLEGMVEVGRRLNEAEKALQHGEFEAMVKRDLPFDVTAAYRLRRVAEFVDSAVIPKADLPGKYTVVFELASLSEEELQAARGRGLVTSTVTRKALIAFKREMRGTAALPAPMGGEELLLGDEAEEPAPPAPSEGFVRWDAPAPPERAAPVTQPPAPPAPPPPPAAQENPDEPGLPFGGGRDGEVLPPPTPDLGEVIDDANEALRRLDAEELRIQAVLYELERQAKANRARLEAISKEREAWLRRRAAAEAKIERGAADSAECTLSCPNDMLPPGSNPFLLNQLAAALPRAEGFGQIVFEIQDEATNECLRFMMKDQGPPIEYEPHAFDDGFSSSPIRSSNPLKLRAFIERWLKGTPS